MTAKIRHPLATMRDHAESIVTELAPYCDRIEIAGSIRRGSPTVADVEIVGVPRYRVEREGLFLERTVNLLDEYLGRELGRRWQLRLSATGAKTCGERAKFLLWDSIPVDLFSVLPPAEYGMILAIRTGSADFSRQLMTPEAHGGWMPTGWRCHDGAIHDAEGNVVPTPEEADVFRVLGRAYVRPEERSL